MNRPRQPDHNEIGAKLDHLVGIVSGISDKQDCMDAKVDELTAMKPDLQQMIEIYSAGRGAVKVGKWAGKLVLWLTGLIATVGGAIAVAKGWLPK